MQIILIMKPTESINMLISRMQLENKSQCTIDNYVDSVKRFITWCKDNKRDSLVQYVQDWILDLRWKAKLAPSSINLHSHAVRYYCNHILQKPVALDLVPRMKEKNDLPDPLTFEEVERMFACENNKKHLLLLQVAYYGGLRLGDIQNLKVYNIRFDRGVIHIENGKGYKDRFVMLPDDIKKPLMELVANKQPSDYVFTSQLKDNEQYPKRTIQKIFQNACIRAGISGKHNIHRLRHTYGAHMVKRGVNLRVIQKTMGHQSPSTTALYTKISCEDIEQMRNVLISNRE